MLFNKKSRSVCFCVYQFANWLGNRNLRDLQIKNSLGTTDKLALSMDFWGKWICIKLNIACVNKRIVARSWWTQLKFKQVNQTFPKSVTIIPTSDGQTG